MIRNEPDNIKKQSEKQNEKVKKSVRNCDLEN